MEAERDIAIFWDYENVPLPSWCSPAEAAKQIHAVISKLGRIVDRRLYFNYQNLSTCIDGPNNGYSELYLSGFDLISNPTHNSQKTMDKRLIADMFTFGWDCAVRNTRQQKPCVVLLTSDSDYSYSLTKLRDRGIMSVVIYKTDCSSAKILSDSADIAMSFEKEILVAPVRVKQEEDNSKVSSMPMAESIQDSLDNTNERIVENQSSQITAKPQIPSIRVECSHFENFPFTETSPGPSNEDKGNPPESKRKRKSLEAETETEFFPDLARFCLFLHEQQIKWSKSKNIEAKSCWVRKSIFIEQFLKAMTKIGIHSKTVIRKYIKAIAEKAINKGYIRVGHKQVGDPKDIYVASDWVFATEKKRDGPPWEVYIILSQRGNHFFRKFL